MLTLQIACGADGIPSRSNFRSWAQAALECSARITIRVIGGREGRRLNRMFRGRDYATNVLTFCYDGSDTLAGDIALCAPVVAREARAQGKSLEAHYAHLVVHGALHLQGHDHLKRGDAARMESKEIAVMARLGFDDPYQSVKA